MSKPTTKTAAPPAVDLSEAMTGALRPLVARLVHEEMREQMLDTFRVLLPRLQDAGVMKILLDEDAVFAAFDEELKLVPRRRAA